MACSGCRRRGAPLEHRGVAKVLHGIVGATKAIARLDRASNGAVEERRRSCLACPKLCFQMCTECGCAIFLKVLVASETCPLGRWPS